MKRYFEAIKFVTTFLFLLCYSVQSSAQSTIDYATSTDEWPPFYSVSKVDKGSRGIFPEMIAHLFEQELGFKVQYKLRPWKRAQREIESGRSDFMLTIPTKARALYAQRASRPLFQLYLNLYIYADHPKIEAIKKIKTIEDIKALDLLLVSTAGNGWHESNVEKKGVRTEQVKTDLHAARFLASKRADGMIDVALSMSPKIKEAGLNGQIELTNVQFGPVDFYIMMSKKSQYIGLMPDINNALDTLYKRGELSRIVEKYNGGDKPSMQ